MAASTGVLGERTKAEHVGPDLREFGREFLVVVPRASRWAYASGNIAVSVQIYDGLQELKSVHGLSQPLSGISMRVGKTAPRNAQ